MAAKGRTFLYVAAVVAVLAAFGWRYSHFHLGAPPAAKVSAVASTAPPSAARSWRLGSLTLSACELGQPDSGLSVAAWCAPFDVPENRADPQGRRITLRLAVVRSSAQVASRDMITFLAGGPGQAATESWSALAQALQPLLAHRHVLLLDQRGTGGSHPLACKEDTAGVDSVADQSGFDLARLKADTQRCLGQIRSRADPRYYTTTVAAEDLEDARRALGSPPLDLVGVSYGTRMAQQYLMRHPEAVRSAVLDGVVPNTLVLGQDFARNLDDALKAQFARCTAAAACRQRFGDPYQTLYQLRDALRANPHKVSIRDPESYRSVPRVLSEYSLVSVVRMFAYSPPTAALLPLSIDAAAHGDVGPLLGQAKLLAGDLDESMDSGMQYSVICSEDADLLRLDPRDAPTLLGNHIVEVFQAVCPLWPKGVRPDDFHHPLTTDKPVLLLSGQYDPVTPPRYGEEVARGLGNARHLVLPGQGHNVLAAGCAPDLVRRFVEDPDPKALDATCLGRLGPTPIFIDFNGAQP